jgi:hypothetical protein
MLLRRVECKHGFVNARGAPRKSQPFLALLLEFHPVQDRKEPARFAAGRASALNFTAPTIERDAQPPASSSGRKR